jgi:hypothetical protein
MTVQTSLLAYQSIKPGLTARQEQVYNALILIGGSGTMHRVAMKLLVPLNCISGRFSELERKGYIRGDQYEVVPGRVPRTVYRVIWTGGEGQYIAKTAKKSSPRGALTTPSPSSTPKSLQARLDRPSVQGGGSGSRASPESPYFPLEGRVREQNNHRESSDGAFSSDSGHASIASIQRPKNEEIL